MNQITPGLLCTGLHSGMTYFLLTVSEEVDEDNQNSCFGVGYTYYCGNFNIVLIEGVGASISTVDIIEL